MTFSAKDLDREHCAHSCAPEEHFLNLTNEQETELIDIISYPWVNIKLTIKLKERGDQLK